MAMMPNLKEMRRAIGMTAEGLADVIGVNRLTLFRWESGNIALSLERAQQVCAVLGAPIDALVRGTWLRPLLLTRLWQGRDTAAAPPSGADVDGSVRALSELLALSLGVAPPGGPALVLARLDGVLASDDAALGRALLEALIARVDASPTLATALSELGPHALAQLG